MEDEAVANDRRQNKSTGSRWTTGTGNQSTGEDGRRHVQSTSRQAIRQEAPEADADKKKQRKKQDKWYVTWSGRIVENKFCVAFTTILTLYALTGDDIRLICTNRPMDGTFDVIVIICLVVFAIECVLSCIGKEDYIWGFFFALDVISTGTLVLDLSVVADALAGGESDDDSMSNLRGGRTARVGAKAGRVVRVLRLVRILKLYKAYYDSKQAKKKERLHHPGDEDDWDDMEVENNVDLSQRESRVGRKLSEMTIRRVIILVLTMLLVFPFLIAPSASQNAESAYYAADDVHHKFEKHLLASQEAVLSQAKLDRLYEDYMTSMLRMMYFHNWFARRGEQFCKNGGCADEYLSQVFWVGIMGQNVEEVTKIVEKAQLTEAAVTKFEETYKDQDDMYNYGTMPSEAKEILGKPWALSCEPSGDTFSVRIGFSLLYPYTPGHTIKDVFVHPVECPGDLRPVERRKFKARLTTFDDMKKWHIAYYFDLRPFTRLDAGFNLIITGFICLVLCVAAMSFSNDANNLVLTPVENMIKRVEAIRENPLIAMKMADEEFKAEEVAKAKMRRRTRENISAGIQEMFTAKKCKRTVNEPMETVILEKTIIKLGSLLALGFGEAGANIIGANMQGSDSAGVNAMIPGVRVECIIGNVKIRDFSVATEVLQSKIMNFVNQIAEIVHGCVDEFHGAANKNNGDMFLIIWRLQDYHTEERRTNTDGKNVTWSEYLQAYNCKGPESAKYKDLKEKWANLPLVSKDLTTRVAEMSVVAFSKVLGALHRSPLLFGYRMHPGLQQRLGTGCRVNLSFALHCGWAIEGAVGSEFKIDASYLSPNVSIVNAIEKATRVYGVPILLAQSVYELLGERMADKCRLIDNVVITGSTQPMNLFSVDCDYMSIKVDKSEPLQITWNSKQRFRARQFNESQKANIKSLDCVIADIFDKDANIKVMRRRFTQEFFQNFNMGYQNYAEGEWAVARRMLVSTQCLLGVEDGPSSALLRFMEEHQYERPKDWPGYRLLNHSGN